MPMEASDIIRLIKQGIPGAEVEIQDLAGDGDTDRPAEAFGERPRDTERGLFVAGPEVTLSEGARDRAGAPRLTEEQREVQPPFEPQLRGRDQHLGQAHRRPILADCHAKRAHQRSRRHLRPERPSARMHECVHS